jgi:phage RecT family recombinase
MLASELGLEPGAASGHLYLIPRKMKDPVRGGRKFWQLTTMIGYRGFAEMARRSTDIKRLNAGVVYQEQVDRGLFVWTDEPPDIRVEGALLKEKKTDAAIVYAWALVEMHSGAKYIEVLDRTDIERRRAKAGRTGNGSPWGDWYPRMARKSAIRALLNGGLVPLNSRMQRGVAHEAEADPAPEAVVVSSAPLVAEAEEVDPLRSLLSIPQRGQVEPVAGRADVLDQIAELEIGLGEAGVEDARREMEVDDLTRLGLDQLKAYRDAIAERSF